MQLGSIKVPDFDRQNVGSRGVHADLRIHLRGLPDALREDRAEQNAGDCLPEVRWEEERDSAFGVQRGEWIE